MQELIATEHGKDVSYFISYCDKVALKKMVQGLGWGLVLGLDLISTLCRNE